MNNREKEIYLREYSLLKAQGKPFFPYAVAKDSLLACVVLASIIGMSILFGAELGPKAEPTTSAPRDASSIARSPVPVATSSAREPGPTRARSAARSRQR